MYFFLSHPRGKDSFTFRCYNFLDNFLLIILSWGNLTTTTKNPQNKQQQQNLCTFAKFWTLQKWHIYHKVFCNWLFPQSVMFLRLIFAASCSCRSIISTQSILLCCAKMAQINIHFYPYTLKFSPVFTIMNSATVNTVSCLLAYLCENFVRISPKIKITGS